MRKFFFILSITVAIIFSSLSGTLGSKTSRSNRLKCKLSKELEIEIDSYQPIVQKIVDTAINGTFRGVVWNELADFVDKFGPRISGSKSLEDAIDYVLDKSKQKNLDNVQGEVAKVPHWVR